MAARINLVALVAIVVVATVLPGSTSVSVHIVGDSLGWREPSNSSVYANWAAQQTFVVGDILVFNFITGRHVAAEVSIDAFNSCNTGNTLSNQTNGPANYTLSSAGAHYFLCTVNDHCSMGQKFQANVTAGSGSGSPQSSPPAPSGSPPSGGSTPSPPSSAPPAAFSALFLLFMSIVFVFLIAPY